MLTVKNLSKTYQLKGKELNVVKSLSFSANRGEVLCFLGPNGAGKTTTIKLLCGLVNPTSGEIEYNSIPVTNRRNYLSKVAVVLEGARNIYWRLTPRENMDFCARQKGIYGESLKKRIDYYMEAFDLVQYNKTECRYLSRGNQQKVTIACALVLEAELLLLDEPTLGLDIDISRKVVEVIENEKRNNRIIIITTHNMEFVESIADRIFIFEDGEVKYISEPGKMIAEYAKDDQRLSTAYLNYLRRMEHANGRTNLC